MSNTTMITMAPPSGDPVPSVLNLGTTNYFPDASGHFTIPASFQVALLNAGWTRIS
jgi:hypothetical protein